MKLKIQDREGNSTEIEVDQGANLMQSLQDNLYEVEAICGGNCLCATCHVYLEDEHLVERGATESELVGMSSHFDPNRSRLSCQIRLSDEHADMLVVIAPEG